MSGKDSTLKTKLYGKLSECADLLSKMAEESEDVNPSESLGKKVININTLKGLVNANSKNC